MKAFRKQLTGDANLDKVQNNVEIFAQQFYRNSLIDGLLIEGVTVTTGTASVAHKLGRTPVGFIVVDKNANADIWTVSKNNTFLTLDASATVTVSLWVF